MGGEGGVGPKAIRTQYADILFRSRLEARWAVFFDTLKIRWEYEPEGYELSSGDCYLPDFLLPLLSDGPAGGLFVEVKPYTPTDDEWLVHQAFRRECGFVLWTVEGPPFRWIFRTRERVSEWMDALGTGYESLFYAARKADSHSFWEPRGSSPTRLGDIVSRRTWR